MSVLNSIVQEYGLDKLNIATQYPSIMPLYQDEQLFSSKFEPLLEDEEPIFIFEKIAGSNMRLVITGDDFFIGDRDDIIHARGDRIITNKCIAPVYLGLTNFLSTYTPAEDRLLVLYGEAYGRTINQFERYTRTNKPGFMLFDAFTIKIDELVNMFDNLSKEKIKEWKDTLKQPFWNINSLENFSKQFELNYAKPIWQGQMIDLKNASPDINEWKEQFNISNYMLDGNRNEDDTIYGYTKGIIIKDTKRLFIRQLDF